MKTGGASSVADHEGIGIANVAADKDIGIHEFAKDLMVKEATFHCQGMMYRRTLLRSKHGL